MKRYVFFVLAVLAVLLLITVPVFAGGSNHHTPSPTPTHTATQVHGDEPGTDCHRSNNPPTRNCDGDCDTDDLCIDTPTATQGSPTPTQTATPTQVVTGTPTPTDSATPAPSESPTPDAPVVSHDGPSPLFECGEKTGYIVDRNKAPEGYVLTEPNGNQYIVKTYVNGSGDTMWYCENIATPTPTPVATRHAQQFQTFQEFAVQTVKCPMTGIAASRSDDKTAIFLDACKDPKVVVDADGSEVFHNDHFIGNKMVRVNADSYVTVYVYDEKGKLIQFFSFPGKKVS